MKRLSWLLLVVCTLAFAKVQPVVAESGQLESSGCCCEQSGSCEMPDCAPPPASPTVNLDRPSQTLRSESRLVAKAKKTTRVCFYSAFAEPAAPKSQPFTSASPMSTAVPPLFRVHCSFLI